MAATFQWGESNGAGQTQTIPVTNVNWKNIDDATTVYTSAPIVAGTNSYEKWQFGYFTGTFNLIGNGFFDHTSGALGTGLTLKGAKTMTADGDKLAYATPSTTTNANLTKDFTVVNASFPTSANVVYFSGTSPTATKATTSSANPTWTNYLTTQLQTTTGAASQDTATVTMSLRYDEN